MSDREHAHELLDGFALGQIAAVVHLLEAMVPSEEGSEMLSPSEREAVAEADGWLKEQPA